MTPTLAIRADASVAIGTGHVMRCLALAQAWQDAGGKVAFVVAHATPAVRGRLGSENFEVIELGVQPGGMEDASRFTEIARTHGADWVVVDGYPFDSEYQATMKSAGLKLLSIDDTFHAQHYFADLVLNQNLHAREECYSAREPYTHLLLGPLYALLRCEFKPWLAWKRNIPALGRKVLITMGGSDPDNATSAAIQALSLAKIKGLEAAVVVGGSSPHLHSVERAAAHFPGSIRLQSNASNMPELMAWADVAVSGAGSTCYEMCLLGLPAIVVDLAENQLPIAQELDRRGVVAHLGSSAEVFPQEIAGKLEWLLSSEETRVAMSRRGRDLVDGQGAQRVVSAMTGPMLRLRRAQPDDCRLLWNWANDPEVRAASFSPAPIPWDEHQAWFAARVESPRHLLLIGHNGSGKPVGQFRVEWRSDHEGEISICVAPEARGKGCGSRLIELGVQKVFATTGIAQLHAFIRPENQASIHAFEGSGLRSMGEKTVKGQTALHYVRARNGE